MRYINLRLTYLLTLSRTLDLLNPKSVSRTTTVPSFTSFRSVVFILSC